MNLVPATIADLELILSHRRSMFSEMGGAYSSQLDEFETASRQYFRSALSDGSYFGLLCEVEGEIVAGGGVLIADWPGSPMNFEPRRAWILNLYVNPEHRGQGTARILLQALIEWCRDNGFRSVALHASERARPIYDKFGFHPTNEMRLLL